jgi:integrase
MQKLNYLQLGRYHTFYFRQRTPLDIITLIPRAKKEVKISLHTKCKADALVKAREHKVMFDLLFTQIRERQQSMERELSVFKDIDPEMKRKLMLEQRTKEAILDQQFTQQLYSLLERKGRIKYAFNTFPELEGLTLSDIDLSNVDKINRFIAIIDLLSSPSLSDPTPYIEQIAFKERFTYQEQSAANERRSAAEPSVSIARMVVKRQKPKPPPSSPNQIKNHAKKIRENASHTVVELLKSDMAHDDAPSLRTDLPDQPREDLVLEGITLENEVDTHNFVKLLALLEKGEDVTLKDFEPFSKPVVVPKTMLKVSELFKKFYDEQSAEWQSEKTHTTNLSFYDTFIDIVGDRFVDELTYEHANLYIETLRKLPPNRKKLKAFKDKSIDDLLAMQGTFEPMKSANVNKNLERLKSVFIWAVQRKYMQVNILERMRVKDNVQRRQAKKQRERFTPKELALIFNSAKYVDGKHNRTYEHWLPLLGLYLGARLGELSQLRISDIYTEDRTWLIDFNDDDDKTLKTINSHRQVPVHKTLIRLGFIKYVQYLQDLYKRRQLKTDLLFPDIVKGRDGYGHNTSKAFDRYLTALEIKAEGKSFHSLRHTFADERKQREENPAMTAELMGHEIDNETLGRYGKDYRITLKKTAIDRYEPLTEHQIRQIAPFKLWREFAPLNTLSRDHLPLIDMKKSVYKNKHLHKALTKALKLKPYVEEPRKPRKG